MKKKRQHRTILLNQIELYRKKRLSNISNKKLDFNFASNHYVKSGLDHFENIDKSSKDLKEIFKKVENLINDFSKFESEYPES